MVQLQANGIGMRFHRQWVFKGVSFALASGDNLLLTGSNGAGKSTLMRILAGQLAPTRGELKLTQGKRDIAPDHWYRHTSWSGPYMELYNDLTLAETFRMHFSFKKGLVSEKEMIAALELESHRDKELRHFSSGMLHRVKVGLALFSQSDLLLLDEASTNMDAQNTRLVWDLTQQFKGDRILVWASNRSEEFDWFDARLDLN